MTVENIAYHVTYLMQQDDKIIIEGLSSRKIGERRDPF